jgi:antitoxin component YwqK of YwqJK toxin-antitoxin module
MHRLPMIKAVLSIAALTTAGAGAVLASFLVHVDDPRLKLVTYDYEWEGRPANAIVYSFYTNHRPKEFFILWQGKKRGTEYIWYDNGQLMTERPHAEGLPHGDWKMWYENGAAKSLKTYELGRIVGEAWSWHPNGQIGTYNRYAGTGEREDTHKAWIPDGTVYYNYVYQNGHKVGVKGGEFCKRLEIIKK